MMDTSISSAQDVINCDLCNNPYQRNCDKCQVRLCLDCVKKHMNKQHSLSDDIVTLSDRNLFRRCAYHSGKTCQDYCHDCQAQICTQCLIGHNKNHLTEKIRDIVVRKKEEVHAETEEIQEQIFSNYKSVFSKTMTKISMVKEIYNNREQEIKSLRKVWHKEIDKIFNKADSLIRSKKEKHISALTTYQTQLHKLMRDMRFTLEQNKRILERKEASDFFHFKPKVKEYRKLPKNVDVNPPSLVTNTVRETDLLLEIDTFRATLSQIPLPDVSYSIAGELLKETMAIITIPTDYKPLQKVVCAGTNEAWICGNNNIVTRIDMQGSVKQTIPIRGGCWPDDITATKRGELIYSDNISRTVNRVRSGYTEVLITMSSEWEPRGVFCTKSGDILVNVQSNREKLIVRYQGHQITQKIHKDQYENPIFAEGCYMLSMTENSKGDVLVADRNSNSVLMINKQGQVRFRYKGTPSKGNESFDPLCIVTDAFDHIIVSDKNNDCLHLLNPNGEFLGCVKNVGLDKPCGLSVDNEGNLWVGLFKAGKIRVIKQLKLK